MIIFIFYQVATRGLYHHQPREDNRSSSQVSEIGSQAGWVSDRRGQDSQMSDTQVADNMRQENQMMDQRVMQDSQMSEAVMGAESQVKVCAAVATSSLPWMAHHPLQLSLKLLHPRWAFQQLLSGAPPSMADIDLSSSPLAASGDFAAASPASSSLAPTPVGDVIPPLLAGAASLGAGSPPPVSYPPTNYGPPPMASASPP